jgi:23S rRNA G2069 N7-methylase RlmK/C1962 C5-methylase RlmI
MKKVEAYAALDGTLFLNMDSVDKYNESWVEGKIEETISKFVEDLRATNGQSIYRLIAKERDAVRAIFDKYDAMLRE